MYLAIARDRVPSACPVPVVRRLGARTLFMRTAVQFAVCCSRSPTLCLAPYLWYICAPCIDIPRACPPLRSAGMPWLRQSPAITTVCDVWLFCPAVCTGLGTRWPRPIHPCALSANQYVVYLVIPHGRVPSTCPPLHWYICSAFQPALLTK